MLDERTITVTAFAGATRPVRFHRIVISLVSLAVLLTVGTGAAYQAFLNHTPKINIKHAALLPAPSVALTPGETVPTKDPAAKDAQNLLLIGSDSRGTVAQGMADRSCSSARCSSWSTSRSTMRASSTSLVSRA